MTSQPFARALLVASLVFGEAAFGADPVFVGAADGGGRAAIRGYDPVAYHLERKPVLGKPEFKAEWNGAEWRFASAANRDAFVLDPVRYAPAFGGYCAFGASRGYKVSTEPEAFAIEGGKLYLNYSIPVANTWNKDRRGYILKATANWMTLEAEPYATDDDSVAKAKAKAQAAEKGTGQ